MSDLPQTAASLVVDQPGTSVRLHPLTLLLNLARKAPQAMIGLLALQLSGPDRLRPWVGLIALVAILALFGLEIWQWWRFSYRLDAQELRIASGTISRNVRSIPYERIQDVNLEQGLLARMLGMAKIRLETGSSSSGDEAVLDSVDLAEAERLRDVIRLRKSVQAVQTGSVPTAIGAHPQTDVDATTAAPGDDLRPMFAMDMRRILVAGIFNFSLIFFALVGALFNNLDFLIPDRYWEPRRVFGLLGLNDVFGALDLTARLVSIMAALLTLIIIGLLGGIIRTVLREHGFRLNRTETGFRRRRGLLTLTDVVMPLHRIQAAVIETGPIRRRLGYYALKVQSLASDSDQQGDHDIAPLARSDEVRAILNETGIRWDADGPELESVDPAMWWVPMVLALPIPIIAIGLAAALGNRWIVLVYALLPVAALITWLQWRAHRYALIGDQLYVRAGIWPQRLTLLPLRRIQSVDIRQNLVSRFVGLAEIAIGVAGGATGRSAAVKVQAIPLEQAKALRAQLLG